jgi:hypothetical protein
MNLLPNLSSSTAKDSRSILILYSVLKLRYDRRSIGQSVLASSTHLRLKTRFLFLSVAGLLMWGALSDERTGLTFTMYNVQ